MPALRTANRPRAAGIARLRGQGVILALAKSGADRVNRRQIHDVQSHRGDVAEVRSAVLERAVASGGSRTGAGKQFVPGTESRLDTIYPHRQLFLIASRQRAVRGAFDQEGKRVAQ